MHSADPGPLTKGARCSSVLDKGALGAMQRSLLVLAVVLAHAGVVQAMFPPPNTTSTTPPPTNSSTTPQFRSPSSPPPITPEEGPLAPSALVRRGRAVVACSGSCSCPSAAAAQSGSITDGSGSYSDGEDCSWVISSVGSSISISFSQFQTEECCDKVVIYSCSSSNSSTSCVSSSELASLSGSSISSSRSWTSTTGYMRVRFTSDSSGTLAGFVGNWATSASEVGTAAGFVGNWVASSSDTVAPASSCVSDSSWRDSDGASCSYYNNRPQACGYEDSEVRCCACRTSKSTEGTVAQKAWFQNRALTSPYVLYVLAWCAFVIVAGNVAIYFAGRYGGAERGAEW